LGICVVSRYIVKLGIECFNFGDGRANVKHAKKNSGRLLGKPDYERLAAFRYTLRRFLSFSETAARKIGLASQQYQALLVVKGYPGRAAITINELAGQLLIKHNSAVGLVNRLQAEGLVQRQTAVTDRRKVDIRLTSKGTRLFERLAATHHAELARIGPKLQDFLGYLSRPAAAARARRLVRPPGRSPMAAVRDGAMARQTARRG
jgi:DNA-binding MarR family transcriptional regulator